MIRIVTAVLLLHHIEGVCKPFDPVKQAFRDACRRIDDAAVVQRARDRRDALVARARSRRPGGHVVDVPAVDAGQHREVTSGGSESVRKAIGVGMPVADVLDQATRHVRGGGH